MTADREPCPWHHVRCEWPEPCIVVPVIVGQLDFDDVPGAFVVNPCNRDFDGTDPTRPPVPPDWISA